eukprot:scaffold1265_cov366-Prasinococcus_capsulatus_cf.AAC.18
MEFALQSVSNVWRSVLAVPVYVEMISSVLEFCLSTFIGHVVALDVISVRSKICPHFVPEP